VGGGGTWWKKPPNSSTVITSSPSAAPAARSPDYRCLRTSPDFFAHHSGGVLEGGVTLGLRGFESLLALRQLRLRPFQRRGELAQLALVLRAAHRLNSCHARQSASSSSEVGKVVRVVARRPQRGLGALALLDLEPEQLVGLAEA